MSLGQDGRRWGETAGAVSLRERRWPAWVCEGPEAGGHHIRILQGWDGKQSLATRAPSLGVPRGHKAQAHSLGLGAQRSLQPHLRSSPWPVAWLPTNTFQLPIFSWVYLPLVYLLWRNVCSSPLPMFELGGCCRVLHMF